MRRRQFLKSAGCFVASASLPGIYACGSDAGESREPAGTYRFPQGVASGDPRQGSVMLWTRVVRADGGKDPIALRVEVSETDDFTTVVVTEELLAARASDFTVRVLVERLSANKTYFYRFVAGDDDSRTGRTRTAPKRDADVPVTFAWVSCQDYAVNFYGPYRQLLNDDAAAPKDEQLAFVLHIGDFIYETRGEDFQQALDDDLQPVTLESKSGKPRIVPEFPSGGGMSVAGNNYANTLDDYRHLYKTYLTDPNLQDARARWPFVCVWDDHEFSDDCWQSQANYDDAGSTDEPQQKRRVAASQAWFEYIPAILSDAQDDGVPPDAKDFHSVTVSDAPYSDLVEVTEPNNEQAISAITIYRGLRFGKHVDLVLTDLRSYRSDHALAEETTFGNPLIFHPRAGLPKDAVNAMDAGKTANGGSPEDPAFGFANPRKDGPPGTMLGAAQKAWWKATMKASDATFRVWGSSVPLLRMLLDARAVHSIIPADLLLSPDAWDGYDTERKELMAFLRDEGILNVVSLSGDHHAHYAGLVLDDHDAQGGKPVMVDISAAAVSSSTQFTEIAHAIETAVDPSLLDVVKPVLRMITYDSTPLGGTQKAVVNLNTLIRYGSFAAQTAADTHDLAMIEAARDPEINQHLRYADAHAHGYGLARVDGEALRAQLVTVKRVFEDLGDQSPGILGTATFVIPRASSASEIALPEPELTGKKPFPLA